MFVGEAIFLEADRTSIKVGFNGLKGLLAYLGNEPSSSLLHNHDRQNVGSPISHLSSSPSHHRGTAGSQVAVVEKLLGAKSLETVVQIQSDYAKTAYADFVVQATKMGELHSNLAKAAFKPAEQVIAAMQGTK